MRLGATHDDKRVGKPHHLQAFFDEPYSNNGCDGVRRLTHFRVVDANNKKVGQVSIKENIEGTLVDSCSGQQVVTASSCAPVVQRDGFFTDIIGTGCPITSTDPNCGFEFTNKYQWCPRNGSPVTLATLNYNVRRNKVTINGKERFDTNENLYP